MLLPTQQVIVLQLMHPSLAPSSPTLEPLYPLCSPVLPLFMKSIKTLALQHLMLLLFLSPFVIKAGVPFQEAYKRSCCHTISRMQACTVFSAIPAVEFGSVLLSHQLKESTTTVVWIHQPRTLWYIRPVAKLTWPCRVVHVCCWQQWSTDRQHRHHSAVLPS